MSTQRIPPSRLAAARRRKGPSRPLPRAAVSVGRSTSRPASISLPGSMPEPQLKKFGHLATPHLEPGERLLDIAVIQPLRGAGGVGVSGLIGSAIASIGAVKGGKGTIADRRVLVLYSGPARKSAQLFWQAPRSAVLDR